MKTTTFIHACPVTSDRASCHACDMTPDGWCRAHAGGIPCEADVVVEYEVGRGREDFFSVVDVETCAAGHVIPDPVAVAWYEEDAVAYGQRLYELYEDMKYYHESGGL